MKLSQWIELINEEFPRIKTYRENIPDETIKMFVVETRKDLRNLETSMEYVEATDLDDVPRERIPKWFEDAEETEEIDLEREFYSYFNEISVDDGLEQYDSIIDKLRLDVRWHTQSFFQESKGLDDSFIHTYVNNGRNMNILDRIKQFGDEGKIYRGSMVINNEAEESDESELDLEEIFKEPL